MHTQALALLADFTNPDLSEVAIAERHALTLDDLRARSAAPAFRRALAVIAEIRETRRPLLIANAESRAAQALTALAGARPHQRLRRQGDPPRHPRPPHPPQPAPRKPK